MPWTYGDAPATTPRDAVRFYLGDTLSTDPQPVSDAEIAFALAEVGDDARLAAAMCARKLAGYYARQCDTSNGALSVSASQRAAAFKDLAAQLTADARAACAPTFFAGGLSVSGNAMLDADSDAVQPMTRLGQDSFPGAAGASDSDED